MQTGTYSAVSVPLSILDRLCSVLARRCADPNVPWSYHPRSGLGALLTDCLIEHLEEVSPAFSRQVAGGDIRLASGQKLGGKKRQKKIDLVIRKDSPKARLVAVEAKACMTAHSKARTRLAAEITSSLDALLDADPAAAFFGLIAINYGEAFTSPLNLPGPNRHESADAPALVESLIRDLSNNSEISDTLVLPISFDNETYCHAVVDSAGQYLAKERLFVSRVLEALDIGA
jgi:hypothetical protein